MQVAPGLSIFGFSELRHVKNGGLARELGGFRARRIYHDYENSKGIMLMNCQAASLWHCNCLQGVGFFGGWSSGFGDLGFQDFVVLDSGL